MGVREEQYLSGDVGRIFAEPRKFLGVFISCILFCSTECDFGEVKRMDSIRLSPEKASESIQGGEHSALPWESMGIGERKSRELDEEQYLSGDVGRIFAEPRKFLGVFISCILFCSTECDFGEVNRRESIRLSPEKASESIQGGEHSALPWENMGMGERKSRELDEEQYFSGDVGRIFAEPRKFLGVFISCILFCSTECDFDEIICGICEQRQRVGAGFEFQGEGRRDGKDEGTGSDGGGSDDDLGKNQRPLFGNIRWGDLLLDPDPNNVLAVGLTGLLTWASVQVLSITLSMLVAAGKYSFIAAVLLFILITLLWLSLLPILLPNFWKNK
ncbi:hypothetical protein DVH24_013677 [Malus domestica]|uniref:Uncharacterized protein n=1 Tax=Malus domestica TaxID=3750 RepID=A0A498JI67_MALDO|nr:hypothetical protein DVH24_013677 [Malus domestica]